MKNLFITLSSLVVLTFLLAILTSCGDDDDDNGAAAESCCHIQEATYPLDEDPPTGSYEDRDTTQNGMSADECGNYCGTQSDYEYCETEYIEDCSDNSGAENENGTNEPEPSPWP